MFLIFNLNSYAQSTNVVVIDSLLNASIENIATNKNLKNIKELELKINDTPLKSKIEALFLDKFSDKSFLYQTNNNIPTISYNLEDIIINYEHTNDNFFNRKIELKINCILKSNDRITLLNKDNLIYKDTIPFDLLEQIQSSIHQYDKGKIPEKKIPFIQKVLMPIIYISTAAITLIILFNARS
jgi:hypothetical protein